MNKFINIIIGLLAGVVVYFYAYGVQSLSISWFPYQWFMGFMGWIVIALIFIGLFIAGRIFKERIIGNIISILVYAILSFVFFTLLFPGYIFY